VAVEKVEILRAKITELSEQVKSLSEQVKTLEQRNNSLNYAYRELESRYKSVSDELELCQKYFKAPNTSSIDKCIKDILKASHNPPKDWKRRYITLASWLSELKYLREFVDLLRKDTHYEAKED
jgi:predicted nuclease with TOPRIM domain